MRHNSRFRMRWDLYVILLTLWNCLFIPFNVAFESEGLQTKNNIPLQISEYFIDFCFLLDICFNFRTTYINSKTQTEVTDPKRIMINYVFFGRFTIDLLATVPFELFASIFSKGGGNEQTIFKIFGMLKLFRLFRIGRIITYMKFKSNLKIGFRIF